MEITRFCPIIVTSKSEDIIAVFEALGFERRHKKQGINDAGITAVTMKHPNGFSVIVSQVDHMERDLTAINMNVRDFNEAFAMLEEHGFRNAQGDKVTETGSSKATMMFAPTGFGINVDEHIRK